MTVKIHHRSVYRDEYEDIREHRQAFLIFYASEAEVRPGEVVVVEEIDDATGDKTGRSLTADTTVLRPATSAVVVGVRPHEDALAAVGQRALREVLDELVSASRANGPFHSAHEGFAVLHEEFDELKEQVWLNPKKRDLGKMRAEAKQVAAMGLRFMIDICPDAAAR